MQDASIGAGIDAGAGHWRAGPPLPVPRFEAYAAAARGKLWFIGGITGTFGDQQSARESDRVDVLDPDSGLWSQGPALPDGGPKHHLAVATIGDSIYVLGGFTGILGGADPAGKFLPNAQTFVLEDAGWRRLADQPVPRGAATAQAIDGIIYVAGGGDDDVKERSDLYAYDPVADRWSVRAPMPTGREHLASCALDHHMLVLGGWFSIAMQTVTAAQIYDPALDRWTIAPDMPTSRGGFGAATLGDRCFAIGGEAWHDALPGTLHANDSYGAADGWVDFAPMPTARHGLGVTALGGVIWTVGGGPVRGNSYTDVVEIFDPGL